MKKNVIKKRKKIKLLSFAAIAFSTPLLYTVACSKKTSMDYTVGFAAGALTSLNYIRYSNSVPVSHALVESFAKTLPAKSSDLYNYLKVKPILTGYRNNFDASTTRSYFGFNLYNRHSGTLRTAPNLESNDIKDQGIYFENLEAGVGDSSMYTFQFNGKSKWSNGELLTASNFIDSLVYILDLNTGSQNVSSILKLGIKNAREFIDVQIEYAKKFGTTYKNPFGYIEVKKPSKKEMLEEFKKSDKGFALLKTNEEKQKWEKEKNILIQKISDSWTYYVQRKDPFPLQLNNPDERQFVDKIEKTARGLGVFGDAYSSHPNSNEKWVIGEPDPSLKFQHYKNSTEIMPFQLHLETSFKKDPFTFVINNLTNSELWLPINRHFVETVAGGILNFGIDKKRFLTEGPFVIDSAILGNNGTIIFKKNYEYFDANKTIPEKVKIYFQTDPTVLATLFEDGFISSTTLNAINAKKFYANETLRPLMSKVAGFGITAFVFNLDKNLNVNPALFDSDLRRAIGFAVDRAEIIKLSGYDATFPVYNIIDAEGAPTNSWLAPQSGVSYGMLYYGQKVRYDDNGKPVEMFPYSASELSLKSHLFSNLDKTDLMHDNNRARFYLNRFLDNHPEYERYKNGQLVRGGKKLVIQFANDSSANLINMGLAFQSQIKKAFGPNLTIDLKGYPKSIYDTYVAEGKFEMIWSNLDKLAKGIQGGVQFFMVTDEVNKKDLKSTGFDNNPTGGWTLGEVFKKPEGMSDRDWEKELGRKRNRLEIQKTVWNKMYELTQVPSVDGYSKIENETLLKNRIDAFFQRAGNTGDVDLNYPYKNHPDANFDSPAEINDFVYSASKLIADELPVVPLFNVDVLLKISRLPNYNVKINTVWSLDYAYDLIRKPKNDLPGIEVKSIG